MSGQSIEKFARLLVPPIVLRAVGGIRHRLRPGKPEWEYVGPSWPAAPADPRGQGWGAPSILDTNKSKWPAFVRELAGRGPIVASPEAPNSRQADVIFHNTMMIYAFSLAMAARHKSGITMLDWGGGIGHFYLISQALVPDLDIDYSCNDLPGLAEYGQQLFPQAHFYTDTSCLDGQYDFVLASSSLQYMPDWASTFTRLARACSGYLLVTRLPITHAAPAYVFVQRPYQYGYQTEYPAWCLNRAEFLDTAVSAGLELVREFSIGFTIEVENAPEPSEYRGFLFRAAAA